MEGDLWYRYQGDAVQNRVLTPYQITVPEGYQLDEDVWGDTFQDEEGGYVREHYVNAAGEEIYFTYVYGTDRWKDMTFAMEDQMERKPLQIHGNPAALSLPIEPEGDSVILWVDNTTGALLEVAAPWRRRTSSPWQRAPRRWNPTFPEKISHSVSKTTAPFRYRR